MYECNNGDDHIFIWTNGPSLLLAGMNFYPGLCGGNASCRSTHQHLVWLKITWAKSRNGIMVCRFFEGRISKTCCCCCNCCCCCCCNLFVWHGAFAMNQWSSPNSPSTWDATVGSCHNPGASYHSSRLNTSQETKTLDLRLFRCKRSIGSRKSSQQKFSPNLKWQCLMAMHPIFRIRNTSTFFKRIQAWIKNGQIVYGCFGK